MALVHMAGFTLATLASAAWAQAPEPVDAAAPAWQLQAKLASLRYTAQEKNALGSVLNTETGSLPSAQLSLRHQRGPWVVELGFSQAANTIAYNGFTQLGLPLLTRTELAWTQAHANVGYHYPIAAQSSVLLGAGLVQRNIDRNILATAGSLPLRETLQSTQLSLQAMVQGGAAKAVLGPGSLSWQAGVQLLPSLRHRLKVDSFGLYDTITLSPARNTDWKVSAGFAFALNPVWSVGADISHQSLRPGASSTEVWTKSGVPSASVRYPGSVQSATGLAISLRASYW